MTTFLQNLDFTYIEVKKNVKKSRNEIKFAKKTLTLKTHFFQSGFSISSHFH